MCTSEVLTWSSMMILLFQQVLCQQGNTRLCRQCWNYTCDWRNLSMRDLIWRWCSILGWRWIVFCRLETLASSGCSCLGKIPMYQKNLNRISLSTLLGISLTVDPTTQKVFLRNSPKKQVCVLKTQSHGCTPWNTSYRTGIYFVRITCSGK